jgi:hypothetical protein
MTSAPNLSFEPRRSRIASILTAAIGALALTGLWFSGAPIPLRIAVAIGVAVATAQALHRLGRPPVSRFLLQAEDAWLVRRLGTDVEAKLQRAHDLGFLIALRFRTDRGQRIDVALWPDAISSDQRRRLRVWLGRRARP